MELQVDADGDIVVQRRGEVPALHSDAAVEQDRSHHSQGDVVLSEVHLECRRLPIGQRNATTFTTADGAEVARIQHSLATPLSQVGLQVWRGALLLADYILQQGSTSALSGCVALELGAGPGLAGLVLSRLARAVYLTDIGSEVLANLERNAAARQLRQEQHVVHVRQLDWLDPPDWLLPPCSLGGHGSECGTDARQTLSASSDSDQTGGSRGFAWQPGDAQQLQKLEVLLAADCIYDNFLTEALMRSAVLLMRYAQRHSGRAPRLLVALERRVVFTLVDMAARAPAYDYWRTLFSEVAAAGASAAAAAAAAGVAAQGPEEQAPLRRPPLPLVGWRLDTGSIPQAIREYERTPHLELWELALVT